ncbi:MAG: hypothetical protein ABIT47_03315 [Candidatus Paceibacterota bacterium]
MTQQTTFKFSDDHYHGGRLAVEERSCFDLEGKAIAEVRENFSMSKLTIVEMMVTYKGGVDSLTAAQMRLIEERSRFRLEAFYMCSPGPRVFTHSIYDGWVNEGSLYLLERVQVNYMRGELLVGRRISWELGFRVIRVNVDGSVESTKTWCAEEVNGLPSSIGELLRVCPDIEFSPSVF